MGRRVPERASGQSARERLDAGGGPSLEPEGATSARCGGGECERERAEGTLRSSSGRAEDARIEWSEGRFEPPRRELLRDSFDTALKLATTAHGGNEVD